MSDEATRPAKGARPESREVTELQALKARHPELGTAVDLHVELAALHRRVRGRIPVSSLEINPERMARHQSEGRSILRFEDIPLELGDLRLLVRQAADLLRRFEAIEDADYQRVQALGRDADLLTVAAQWFRGAGGGSDAHPQEAELGMVGEVLALAMQPFLARCTEVLQQRSELSLWTHAHCALCGGEPNLSVVTPAAERHLICGRCSLQWRWDPLACPYCGNEDRRRITSFATADGLYRVYACDVCHRYLKAYDGRRARRPVMPIVEAVATLPLDAAAVQRGYTS